MTVGDLYATFSSSLLKHARYLTANKDDADDLLQETFIRAMKHLRLLESLTPNKRRAWLFRTMSNLFVDKRRARRGEVAFLRNLRQLSTEETLHNTTAPTPMANIHEILKLIPEKHHDLIHMCFVLGMTSQEIANTTGIPASTIRSRLRAALKKLRELSSRIK